MTVHAHFAVPDVSRLTYFRRVNGSKRPARNSLVPGTGTGTGTLCLVLPFSPLLTIKPV